LAIKVGSGDQARPESDGADGNGTADRGQRQHKCKGEGFHRMASDFDPAAICGASKI
jgi:hypothetical protein